LQHRHGHARAVADIDQRLREGRAEWSLTGDKRTSAETREHDLPSNTQ
jgi:hypothetical protein